MECLIITEDSGLKAEDQTAVKNGLIVLEKKMHKFLQRLYEFFVDILQAFD